jgi:hypothetical protein
MTHFFRNTHQKTRTPRLGWSFLLAMLLLLGACKSDGKKANTGQSDSLKRYFVGEWVSQDLELRINSYGNTDSLHQVIANPDNWERVMEQLPIRTIFMADNRYRSEYRDLDSNLIDAFSGVFEVDQDSIVLHILKPKHDTRRHAWVSMNDSTCGFSSVYDADLDGVKDDEFFTIMRKVAN